MGRLPVIGALTSSFSMTPRSEEAKALKPGLRASGMRHSQRLLQGFYVLSNCLGVVGSQSGHFFLVGRLLGVVAFGE